jgi:hypothetical protein
MAENCNWSPADDGIGVAGDSRHQEPAAFVVRKGRSVIKLCASCAGLPKFVRIARYEPKNIITIEQFAAITAATRG